MVFVSLDRSVQANREAESLFYNQVSELTEIPSEYKLHLHANTAWGEVAGTVAKVLNEQKL